jgi:spermidine synthase
MFAVCTNKAMKKKLLIIILMLLIMAVIWQSKPFNKLDVIYSQTNKFGKLWVYETNTERCMSFEVPSYNCPRQSCIKLQQPQQLSLLYQKLMLGALYVNPQPKHVLMIGLGGGNIAQALFSLLPKMRLDIVEINPLVVEIARNYFFFAPQDNTKVFIEDGVDFVTNASARGIKYDLVMIDAFAGDYIPASFLTLEFTARVRKILSPNGVVVLNTFEQSIYHDLETSLYNEIFGNFLNLRDRNRIIIARNGELPSALFLEQAAKNWENDFARLDVDSEWLLKKFEHP